MADKKDLFENKSTGDTPQVDATNTTPAQESAPSNEAKPRRSRRSAAKSKNPEGDVAPTAQGTAASTGTPEGATASDMNYKDTPIGQAVMQDDFTVDLARQKNQIANGHMRHLIALSFLQEEEFSEEREAFYAKVYEKTGEPVSVADGENYIAKLMDPWDGHPLLREAAPDACLAAEDYIANTNVDGALKEAGYSAARLSPEFTQQMQLTQAYANRIGGNEGHKGFVATLKEYQESFRKGMGDPKVGLAISGTMLGMGVMLGTGPAGLAIGAVKCAHKLLETPTGQQFQKRLSETAGNFLEKMGVDPAVLGNMNRSVQQIAGNKWVKWGLLGVGVATAVAGLSLAAGESPVKLTDFGGAGTDGVTLPTAPVDTSEEEILATIHGENPDLSGPDSCEPSLTVVEVKVQSGQTLWGIAKEQYQLEHPGETPNDKQIINMVNEIAEHNGIEKPNRIFPGQTLQIPPNMTPSSEMITGSTDWLGQGSNPSSRVLEVDERLKDWRDEHPAPESPASPPTIRA